MRAHWLAAVAAASVLALPAPSPAQGDYPSRRPVTLVTPYAPGGGSDTLTRILGDALRKELGQQVIVQNMPGSGGIIGSRAVAHAEPDGYTLLSHHVGIATSPALYRDPQFDPVTSYAPIGLFADTPMVLVGGSHLEAKSIDELVARLRNQPGQVTFASSGSGSATHLCALLFEKAVGRKFTMIQYRGAAPAVIDVVGGRVDLFCDVTAGSIIQTIQSGQVRAFMITAKQRLASLPQVPTSAEAGLPGVDVTAWYGLYAPAKTPAPVVERLTAALRSAMTSQTVIDSLARMETTVFGLQEADPAALRRRVSEQTTLWTSILKDAGVAPQ